MEVKILRVAQNDIGGNGVKDENVIRNPSFVNKCEADGAVRTGLAR